MAPNPQNYSASFQLGRVAFRDGIFLVKRPGMISNGYDHYGVWICGSAHSKLGHDSRYPVVIHKTDSGIAPVWADFSGEWSFVASSGSVDAALFRLQSAQYDSTFDLIFKNCEHFARFVVEGIEQSTQIQNIVGLGTVCFALYLLSDRDGN